MAKMAGRSVITNVFVLLSAAVSAAVIFLLAVNRVLRKEKDSMEIRQKMMEEFHTALLEQNRMIARSLHDIDHEREYLLQALAQDQLQEAIEFLEKKLDFQMREKVWSGFPCLDFVINRREKWMDENDIRFEAVHYPERIPIPESEFMILFGNLMDNALEAAICCAEGKRWIRLDFRNNGEIFWMQLKNSCLKKPQIKKEVFHTEKKDDLRHGWGLRNVSAIVEKYHGDLSCTCSEGEFEVRVIFWSCVQ